MGDFRKELKDKTDLELLDIVARRGQFNDSYVQDVLDELASRNIEIKEEEKEPERFELTVDERRKVCDSCKNHKNEILTNPDSPALCGLTMKAPSFHGKECGLYIPIPDYKSRVIRRGIYGLVMAIAFGVLGVIRLIEFIEQTKNPANLDVFGLMFYLLLIFFSIALLYYAFKSFITAARFKYPQ